ncbi:DUF1134 domain-containing protein [Pseudovibrio axinellae]
MTSLFTNLRNRAAIVLCASLALLVLNTHSFAQSSVEQSRYHEKDILSTGHQFFGSISTGLAQVVERAIQQYGEPNGYILGQEGSAAFFAGASYGEGTLYTRNAGNHQIFWQGPSLGFDVGGDGARVMMLVYDLPSVDAIFRRYVGANGSAYLVGGFGMQVLSNNEIFVVPVRAGVGARLGLNMGYLKFTRKPTWNPF